MLDCSICTAANVCKYKEEFLEAKRIIEDEAAVHEDILKVSVDCKYCHSIVVKRSVLGKAE